MSIFKDLAAILKALFKKYKVETWGLLIFCSSLYQGTILKKKKKKKKKSAYLHFLLD